MKKNYLFTLTSALFISLTVSAVNIAVTVGGSGNTFTPSSFTANVGDVVVWTWASGNHDVTSMSVPSGAATFASPNQATGTYSYTIASPGNYTYKCIPHFTMGMAGGFTVSSGTTGILEPATNLLVNVYPNPFEGKVTVKYNGVQSIDVFNILGDKVKTVELSATENKAEIDFENLPSGAYFFRVYSEGVIVETKRIIKSK
ncbi:MAG: T9SS type A sorting domain-containing protein [Bacteroidota bacterium]